MRVLVHLHLHLGQADIWRGGTGGHYDGSDSHQRPDYTGRLEIERQTNSGNKRISRQTTSRHSTTS